MGEIMKERPIIFKTEMVRAILDGRKTQTRRVIKPQPIRAIGTPPNKWPQEYPELCPYGQPGDRLWVRETWWKRPFRTQKMMIEGADTWPKCEYDATAHNPEELKEWEWKRKPSIHMPKKYARIWLEIINIRVEKLQDITEKDAKAEGVHSIWGFEYCHSLEAFYQLWDSINGKKHPWADNPWVWVVEFKTIVKPQ